MDDRRPAGGAHACANGNPPWQRAVPALALLLAVSPALRAGDVPGPFRLDIHWGSWQASHEDAALQGRDYPRLDPEVCWTLAFPVNLEFYPDSLPGLEGCLFRRLTRLQEKICGTSTNHPYWQAELRSMEILPAPGQVLDLTNEAAPGAPPNPVGCRPPHPWELLAERNRGRERGMCALGNPINPASGNKFQAELDYVGAGPHPVRWVRYYNSDATVPVAHPPGQSLGAGWSHSYNGSLWRYRVGTDFHLMAYRPDGRAYRYRWDHALQDYVGPSDVADRFVRQDNGEWGFRNADGSVEIYGYTSGDRTWLTEIRYPGGARVRVQRTGAGEITAVDDPTGRRLAIATRDGRLETLTDPAGAVYAYAYETAPAREPLLASVTYPGTGTPRRYLYGEPAHVGGSPHDAMKLTGIVDENGDRHATWRYDERGRAWHGERAGGAGAVSIGGHAPPDAGTARLGSVTFTDANGQSEVQTYEVVNGHAKMSAVLNGQCAHCEGRPLAATYDARGFRASRRDAAGHLAYFRHDALGNETCRLEGVPGNGEAADNALRLVHREWHADWRVPVRERVFAPIEPGMIPPAACDASPAPAGWVLRRETETVLVPGTDRVDYRLERSFPADPDDPPRRTDYVYYGEAAGDDPALAALGLLHAIDGPRTDVADVTRFFHAVADTDGGRTGDLLRVVDAAGNTVEIGARDAVGRPLEIIDANGVATALAWHPRGWLIARTEAAGIPAAGTTRIDYDAVGQPTRVTLPDGAWLAYTHDAAHRLTGINDAAGNAMTWSLDAFGNRTLENVTDPGGAIRRTVRRVYDPLNRLASVVLGEGETTAFRYDANGNVETRIDPRDEHPDPHNISPQVATRFLHDALDRVRRVVDAAGGATDVERNVDGLPTRVVDPNGVETRYVLNGFGERREVHSPDAGVSRFIYNEAGNPVRREDARGVVVHTRYDAINRPVHVDYSSDTDIVFDWDEQQPSALCPGPRNGRGRLTSMTDESGATHFHYDARGRVACRERLLGGQSKATRYAYDAADRLVSLTYPSGRRVDYARDTAGRVSRVSMSFRGETMTLLDAIEHAPFGPPVAWTLGNGLDVRMPLDRSYRLRSIVHGDALEQHIRYDAAGNPTAIDDAADPDASETFAWDANSRLTRAAGPYGRVDYAYDDNGNRTALTVDGDPAAGGSARYAYAPGTNRLDEVQPGGTAQPIVRTYDAVGNTLAVANPATSHTIEYAYGEDGRLDTFGRRRLGRRPRGGGFGGGVRVLRSGDGRPALEHDVYASGRRGRTHTLLHYDEAGRLLAVGRPSGRSTDYIYLGQRLVALASNQPEISRYEPDPENPAVQTPVAARQPLYVQTNAVGMPVYASDADGATGWRLASLEPFGRRSVDGTVWPRIRLGFPGQIDSIDGLAVYNHFREYEPATGRYLQSDPIGLAGGANRYTYANNNPLVWVDPLGLFCLTLPQIEIVAAAGGGAVAGGLFGGGIVGALAGATIAGGTAAAAHLAGGGGFSSAGAGAAAGFAAAARSGGSRRGGAFVGAFTSSLAGNDSNPFSNTIAGSLGGFFGGFSSDVLFGDPRGRGFGPISAGLRGGVAGIAAGFTQDFLRDYLLRFECEEECGQ